MGPSWQYISVFPVLVLIHLAVARPPLPAPQWPADESLSPAASWADAAGRGMGSSSWSEAGSDSFRRMEMNESSEDEGIWTTDERAPLQPDRATWWVTAHGLAHRLRRSILDHFGSLQLNGVPFRRKTGSRREGKRRTAPRRETILETSRVRAGKYWPPVNISQTIYTEDWKGLEASLEFSITRISLQNFVSAELSIKVTHATRPSNRSCLLYGHFNELNKKTGKKGSVPPHVQLISNSSIPSGSQNLVFDITGFIGSVERSGNSSTVLLSFRVRWECDTEEVKPEATRSTFNWLGSKLGQGCHSIISDSNPYHHFLRVDYYVEPEVESRRNSDILNNNARIGRESPIYQEI